jgi:hypothetical protein
MIAAQLVHTVHWIFLLFVLTGWMLPWPMALIAHLLIVPGLILHWRTNENRCILTELEERFKVKDSPLESSSPPLRHETAEEGQFLKAAWTKAYGKKPTDEIMSRITYGTMIVVWILSLGRWFYITR